MSNSAQYSSLRDPDSRSSSDEGKTPEIELEDHEQLNTDRGFWRTCALQSCFLAWAGPVLYLLYINFRERRIGASAWCPDHQCQVDWFNPHTADPERNLKRYDHWSHNLLGVLQIVAKALEVWFALIAAALVYTITFMIAGKDEGLPVGYLTRPSEFAEIPGLFDPLLWRTLRSPPERKREKRVHLRLYLFVGFTVLLCILCNLMGPAAAVLSIPALQWINTGFVGNVTFANHNGASLPGIDYTDFIWRYTPYCSIDELRAMNYSCANDPFATELDTWISTYTTAGELPGDDPRGTSQQDTVRFVLNITSTQGTAKDFDNSLYMDGNDHGTVVHWVPNRQVMSSLSQDRDIIEGISQGYDDKRIEHDLGYPPADDISGYREYNEALQLIVQKNGPIFGTMANMWVEYDANGSTTTTLGPDQAIKCYYGYDLFYAPLVEGTSFGEYTKCIRLGSKWSTANTIRSFSISAAPDANTTTNNASALVQVISSDKAVFLDNGILPTWLPMECLADGQAPTNLTCDYDRLFNLNDTLIQNRTSNVITIEMTLPSNDGTANATLAVDFVAFYNFTLYTLDPSPITNPLYFVQTQDLPTTGTSAVIDPAWVLAAWTVDADGTLYSNRTSTITLMHELQLLLSNNSGLPARTEWDIDYVALMPIIQTLSMLDYHTAPSLQTNAKKQTDYERWHTPLLQRNAKLWLWAYGLTSRTSIMGAVIATAGVLVVSMQFVIGFIDRRKYRSPTQLLVAALEHAPADEFASYGHDETKVAKVAFHVKAQCTERDSYFMFRKTV